MSDDVSGHDLRARSFGEAAELYARVRPGYPADAIDWLVPAGARRVADLGAGSGQLTAGLVDRGLEVVAVEPSAEMRRVLGRRLPQVRALAGTAEEIPLPDGACDAVVVGQAWHWVDPARAVPEVARVLAPGGRIGLVWNLARRAHRLGGRARADPPRPRAPINGCRESADRAAVRAGTALRHRLGPGAQPGRAARAGGVAQLRDHAARGRARAAAGPRP